MKYDVIIFGASGFTGQFILEEFKAKKQEGESLSIAAAGRNESKLKKTLELARRNTKLNFDDIEIIIADVNDYESLVKMASQAKLVINCVGPYRFHGEKVVKACLEGQCDYMDISGEPEFLESIQLKYNEEATEKNLHIIGSCGFDSVPADLGVVFLQNSFDGDLNSVEMIVSMDDGSQGSAPGNATTLECAVHGFSNRHQLSRIRRQLFTSRPPPPKTKLKPRSLISWSNEAKRWCLPNMASDKSVVRRTQFLNFERNQSTPVQFEAYFGIGSLFHTIGALAFGLVFTVMASFQWTRQLIIKYPSVFSFGFFAEGGADRSDLRGLKFCITFIGKGWKDGRPNDESSLPNSTLVTKVTGPDPGYFGTAIIISQCALTLLKERASIPKNGGVHTPGAAFQGTTLIERLNNAGIKFSVESS